ncbi:hypothetical protein L9F63_024766, partial [Diploptera punctata]
EVRESRIMKISESTSQKVREPTSQNVGEPTSPGIYKSANQRGRQVKPSESLQWEKVRTSGRSEKVRQEVG